MKTDRSFDVITPSEIRDLGFDFRNDVASGETLLSADFTLELEETLPGATVDASPNSHKVGLADIDDNDNGDVDIVAVQRVSGLVDGNKYRIIARALTTNDQVLELYAYAWCRVAD